jgi:hypothetical protein
LYPELFPLPLETGKDNTSTDKKQGNGEKQLSIDEIILETGK